MPKNSPAQRPACATAADVEWVDQHQEALICGYRFTKADIVMAELPGERRPDGLLTVEAKKRIADMLTGDIRRREERAFADWRARNPGREPQYRQCEGLAVPVGARAGRGEAAERVLAVSSRGWLRSFVATPLPRQPRGGGRQPGFRGRSCRAVPLKVSRYTRKRTSMSEMDELIESVSGAVTGAEDAHRCTANADDLCSRIVAGGEWIGFGNDPVLIYAAHSKVQEAMGNLTVALTDLEEAHSLISQAHTT